MRLVTNSDPKQSGSSEWIHISERIRERLAEESLWKKINQVSSEQGK